MRHRGPGGRDQSIRNARVGRVDVRLEINAGLDHRPGKNCRDLVGRGVVGVLVKGDNEQAVVRFGPLIISVEDVRLEPGIALRDRAVVHVVLLVRHDE